jgi:hypothetical protein
MRGFLCVITHFLSIELFLSLPQGCAPRWREREEKEDC